MIKNEQPDEGDSQASSLGKYAGIAFQMVAIIGIFSYAGYKIDAAANHSVKWATASLALTGVFLSLYFVIRSLNKQ